MLYRTLPRTMYGPKHFLRDVLSYVSEQAVKRAKNWPFLLLEFCQTVTSVEQRSFRKSTLLSTVRVGTPSLASSLKLYFHFAIISRYVHCSCNFWPIRTMELSKDSKYNTECTYTFYCSHERFPILFT